MTDRTGSGHRGIIAVVVAVVCAIAGVTSLYFAFNGGTHQPPQPTAAQAGRLPGSVAGPGPTSKPNSAAPSPAGKASPVPSPAATPTPVTGPVLAKSMPVSLDIPAIGVQSSLLHLGLNPDGSLEVPWKPLMAGWFEKSPTPGQVGPSVIAGHVDSWQTGPAVFYHLGQLTPGERVDVGRADGTTATFVIDGVRAYAKADFPTLAVYGNTNQAELRLITCGDWNPSRQEYDGNIVVFAHLTGSQRTS
ncbi:MAG: class F sortase [Nocardioidaceae bacterium]